MTNVLSPTIKQQFFANNGSFNVGGLVFTYAAGSSTPIATYTATGATNTNPITLNSRGECDIWLTPNVGYKIVLQDSSGNQIWSVDNVVNAQLLTLFGGVDTGIANAYVLNFTASFTSLTNGIVIYFISANSNTGPSTLNVNGLGVVPIINTNGQPLSSGQIVGGSVAAVMYYSGNWLLISSPLGIPTQGSFTANFTGVTGIAAQTVAYILNGSLVTLSMPYVAGTSNSAFFTITGLPLALQPQRNLVVWFGPMQDNGVTIQGLAQVGPANSSITLWKDAAGQGTDWTATGAKGVGYKFGLIGYGANMTYILT